MDWSTKEGFTSLVEFEGGNAPVSEKGNTHDLGGAITHKIMEENMLETSRFIKTPVSAVDEAPTLKESSSKEKEHTVKGMLMWEEAIGLLTASRSRFVGGGDTVGCDATSTG